MLRVGRVSAWSVAAVLLVALLGAAPVPASAGARQPPAGTGGRICVALAWASPPGRATPAFILADSTGTVWRVVRPPATGGEGCEDDLPAGRYLVCAVTEAGYAVVPLPASGQHATATCVGLALAGGEAAQVAFRNVPVRPATQPTAAPLPGLPNTGGGAMAARPAPDAAP